MIDEKYKKWGCNHKISLKQCPFGGKSYLVCVKCGKSFSQIIEEEGENGD